MIDKKILQIDNKIYEPWLYPKKLSMWLKMFIYITALFLVLYSALIVISECMIWVPEYTVIYQISNNSSFEANYFATIFFICSLVFYCLFTLTNIKFVDFYTLVPHHTDCLSLSSLAGLMSKTISVLLVNYVIMID